MPTRAAAFESYTALLFLLDLLFCLINLWAAGRAGCPRDAAAAETALSSPGLPPALPSARQGAGAGTHPPRPGLPPSHPSLSRLPGGQLSKGLLPHAPGSLLQFWGGTGTFLFHSVSMGVHKVVCSRPQVLQPISFMIHSSTGATSPTFSGKTRREGEGNVMVITTSPIPLKTLKTLRTDPTRIKV